MCGLSGPDMESLSRRRNKLWTPPLLSQNSEIDFRCLVASNLTQRRRLSYQISPSSPCFVRIKKSELVQSTLYSISIAKPKSKRLLLPAKMPPIMPWRTKYSLVIKRDILVPSSPSESRSKLSFNCWLPTVICANRSFRDALLSLSKSQLPSKKMREMRRWISPLINLS